MMRIPGVFLIGIAVVLCFIPVGRRWGYFANVLSVLGILWGMSIFNYAPNDFGWQMMRESTWLFTAVGVLCALASLADESKSTIPTCRQ